MEPLSRYATVFVDAFVGYGRYLAAEVTEPSWHNYVYALLLISSVVYALELMAPWRKTQGRIRRDFWLDGFYVVFNFFLFSLLGYQALASVVEQAFSDVRAQLGLQQLAVVDVGTWPTWAQLLAMFVLRDFIQYWIHRLLHRVPALWEIHKVHHSVLEMGFAAHLRFHCGETIVYRTLEYVPLGLIGFGLQDFYAVHLFALTIGHLNHANIRLPIGPLRYVFNSPQMHIWHHARSLPARHGANFGLSLSLWDWVFGSVHWPQSGRDVKLGFEDVEVFPTTFLGQLWRPLASAARAVARRS